MTIYIKIIHSKESDNEKAFEFNKSSITIGRGDSQDLCLEDGSISRRHCLLEKREYQWRLSDENSKNGTYLNGHRIVQSQSIKHGDVIQVGQYLLLVGIDRVLKEKKHSFVSFTHQALTRIVILLVVIISIVAIAWTVFFLYRYHLAIQEISVPLDSILNTKIEFEVFKGIGPRKIGYRIPDPLCKGKSVDDFIVPSPVLDWDPNNVWQAVNEGQKPSLFQGLDVWLSGGKPLLLSSYFFRRRVYYTPDLVDPFGVLYFELEGWGGLGHKYNIKDIGLIRLTEFPRYVLSINMYPQNIRNDSSYNYPGEVGSFQGYYFFDPLKGHPLGNPSYQKYLAPFLGRNPVQKIDLKGKTYMFLHEGSLYSATLRGSAHLLSRFDAKGSVDKGLMNLANQFFKGIYVYNSQEKTEFDQSTVVSEINKGIDRLTPLVSKTKILEEKNFHYMDLLSIRQTLLKTQHFTNSLEGEDCLKYLYFRVRDKIQRELEECAQAIFDGNRFHTPQSIEEGRKKLEIISGFLGSFLSMSGLQDKSIYREEWEIFYSRAKNSSPYNK